MKAIPREERDQLRNKIRIILADQRTSNEQKISKLLGISELTFALGQETQAKDAHRYPERHELRR